jgi:hypothetical protein
VEDIDPFLKLRDVKHPEGAVSPDAKLICTGSHNWHRFEVAWPRSLLYKVEFTAGAVTSWRGEPLEVRQSGSDPDEWFSLHNIHRFVYLREISFDAPMESGRYRHVSVTAPE